MFGISFTELLVVFSVVLIIFGPEKLPEIASTFGKAFASFRKSADSIRREFYNSVYTPAEDFKRSVSESARELTTLTSAEEAKRTASSPDTAAPRARDNQFNSEQPDESEEK